MIRRRLMDNPENVLLYWDYTMGMPEENGWTSELLNGGTATMSEDGLILYAGNNYSNLSVAYKKTLEEKDGGIKFRIIFKIIKLGPHNVHPFFFELVYGKKRMYAAISNSSHGMQWISEKNIINIFGSTLETERLYTLDIEYDGDSIVCIYLDGILCKTFGISAESESTASLIVGQIRGGETMIQMISIEEV